MIEITPEDMADSAAIEALLDRAFGTDRLNKQSYGFRTGVTPVAGLCMVARDGEKLIGTIRYWPILIGAAANPALLLGPVAVEAAYRRHGLGATLIRRSMAEAAAQGHRLVVLVGDRGYYERFGFREAAAFGVVMPLENPARVQMVDLAAAEAPQIPLDDGIIHRCPSRALAVAA